MSVELLCCGDATHLDTWSNIPYFLLQAGRSRQLFSAGLALHPEQLRWQRRLWNLQQWLRTGRPGASNTALVPAQPLAPSHPGTCIGRSAPPFAEPLPVAASFPLASGLAGEFLH